MARRKVTQTGTGSFSVIIPMKWAKKYQIQKGADLEAEEKGNKLILTVEKAKGIEEPKEINQEDYEPYEPRVINKLYCAGYENIKVNLSTTERNEHIKTEIKAVNPGLILTEETSTYLSFSCTSADEESMYKNFEKKAFQSGLQLAEEMLEILEKGDYDKLKKMKNYELLNTQFCNFCQRYLNKKGEKNYAFTYVIIWGLEKVVDEYEYLAIFLMEHKPKLSKESLAYFKKANEFLENFYKLYTDYNTPLFSKIYKNKKSLVKEGYKLMLIKTNKEAIAISHMITIIKLIFDLTGNILGKKES